MSMNDSSRLRHHTSTHVIRRHRCGPTQDHSCSMRECAHVRLYVPYAWLLPEVVPLCKAMPRAHPRERARSSSCTRNDRLVSTVPRSAIVRRKAPSRDSPRLSIKKATTTAALRFTPPQQFTRTPPRCIRPSMNSRTPPSSTCSTTLKFQESCAGAVNIQIPAEESREAQHA